MKTKFTFLAILLFVITSMSFGQNYFVSPSGNDVTGNGSSANPWQTIQKAVSASIDGCVIHIANGTYTLIATLNLNHELSLIGESETGVIINATGTPSKAWGINPNKSNTTLSYMTIIPNGSTGGYPIHVGDNSTPVAVISNVTLSHITINGANKTAFDFNGVDNLTLSYLTATNSGGGNGIQVSGCTHVNATYLTTSGNKWGGFAVYVSTYVDMGSDDVIIDGTTSSFGEWNKVYSQDEASYFNTNITVSGFDYKIKNSSLTGYTFYQIDEPTAFIFAADSLPPSYSSLQKISTGQFLVSPPLTIQAAVNAATPGSIINVAAGTYEESVNINKSLSLIGAGYNNTTVIGPINGAGYTMRVAAAKIIIDGFTITRDGNNPADWNNPKLSSSGIAIQGQTNNAEIRNTEITGMRTAIDINNSNGNNIHNNIIDNNRTGLLFRNQTDYTTVVQNDIINNWTMGVLFIDASGGTNSPVQSALNSHFNNNNICGNWYGQIVDRQTGGALPLPGTTNLKDFTNNWYGTFSPVITINDSREPGYSLLIPKIYGGTAVAPGGQPDIAGPASANFKYIPFLISSKGETQAAKNILTTYLAANPNIDKKTRDAALKAIGHIDKSLDAALWDGINHLTEKGDKVFDEEKDAVQDLTDKKFTGQFDAAIYFLLAADSNLAKVAINEAGSGDPHELAMANKKFEKALADYALGKYDNAIDDYKKAWEHAVLANKKTIDKSIAAENIEISHSNLPVNYSLGQNYPNPFNPSTVIQFDLPEAAIISLRVFNTLGQIVATLISNQSYEAGRFEKTFDASKFPSGVYIYQFSSSKFNVVKKMILMK